MERFTKYEPYTLHMRSSEHAPSRHTRYLASLMDDYETDADRIEPEQTVLKEDLDIIPVQESNTVMDVEAEEVSSEVEEISRSDFEEAAASGVGGIKESEVDELPAKISKGMERRIKVHQAADYLKRRWGPDVTKYVPAQSQYPPGRRQLDLEKWPGGVVEQLAQLAMLTSDSQKRRQALDIMEENIQKRIKAIKKVVFEADVSATIRSFPALNSMDMARVDQHVPLLENEDEDEEEEEEEEDKASAEIAEEHFDPDILEMDLNTLRVELTKARQKTKLTHQVLMES